MILTAARHRLDFSELIVHLDMGAGVLALGVGYGEPPAIYGVRQAM